MPGPTRQPEKPANDEFEKLKLAEARRSLCDKELLKAVETLHVPFAKFEGKRGAEEAARVVVEHFGDKDKAADRLAVPGHLADEGARMYAASMSSIQLIALAPSVQEWSKKIPELEKQPASRRKSKAKAKAGPKKKKS